jgi:hypothetical protein
VAGALLGLYASGCGGGTHGRAAALQRTAASEEGLGFTSTTTSYVPAGQGLRGDGDADNPGDIDGNGDSDAPNVGGPDPDSDGPTRASYRFPDADDRSTFAYGHRPGGEERRRLAAIVRRYYGLAAAGDGAGACAMLEPSLAGTVAQDYGRAPGPRYLRGSDSCKVVMSRLFRHVGKSLSEAIRVVDVGVQGRDAQVIFSSRQLPASMIDLARYGSSWRLRDLLGGAIP